MPVVGNAHDLQGLPAGWAQSDFSCLTSGTLSLLCLKCAKKTLPKIRIWLMLCIVFKVPSDIISSQYEKLNLIDELYTPCLKWAERFDRGVGYFTTGWLTYNVAGLSDFASRGGKMRLITSPILSTEDTDAIIGAENQDGSAFLRLEAALLENVEILKQEMEADIINAFSWMLYDGIIDMRFAIPCEKLEEGDFHDKFGIFYKGNDALSFSGSINDSKHGFQNYESIKVFKTWAGTQEYVDADTARFEKRPSKNSRN